METGAVLHLWSSGASMAQHLHSQRNILECTKNFKVFKTIKLKSLIGKSLRQKTALTDYTKLKKRESCK